MRDAQSKLRPNPFVFADDAVRAESDFRIESVERLVAVIAVRRKDFTALFVFDINQPLAFIQHTAIRAYAGKTFSEAELVAFAYHRFAPKIIHQLAFRKHIFDFKNRSVGGKSAGITVDHSLRSYLFLL